MKFAKSAFGKMMVYNLRPINEDGANKISLRQAQKNFITFGACEEGCI